jgi:biopolymer transport protein ExbD
MSFSFAATRPRRRPSLTPMIDVVFLLLVFFMLAARLGREGALDLRIGAGDATAPWQGPPRLIRIAPDALMLNGRTMALDDLVSELHRLTRAETDLVLIQPADQVDLQRLLDVMAALDAAGFRALALVQP